MGNKVKSDFLVATGSCATGAARLLDWYGQFDQYNNSRNGDEADAKALYADWAVVGDEISAAMSIYAETQSVD